MSQKPIFEVVEAEGAALEAAGLLLPEAGEFRYPPALLAAVVAGEVVGAAAVGTAARRRELPGVSCALRVAEPWRHRGVGRALVEAGEARVRAMGLRGLYALRSAPRGSEEAIAWERLGFGSLTRLCHYVAPLSRFIAMIEPIEQRLKAGGRVPTSARLVPLHESPIGEIIYLQTTFLGGRGGAMAQRLRGQGERPFDQNLSRVALVGDRVAGFVLCRAGEGDTAFLDFRVVATKYRRGWVNVLLLADALRTATAAGYANVRFDASERNADTRRLASKAVGDRLVMMETYFRPLPPGRRSG